MNDFSTQLTQTRSNLLRLERLAQECPDLFNDHASLIQVNTEGSRIYIHATTSEEARAIDWLTLAAKYQQANWKREQSPAHHDRYDWNGVIDGIEIAILGAEMRPEPQPLFAEGVAV